jgi:beta-glucanase (GH16 family)
VLLALALPVSAAAQSGLVAAYGFNEGSGTTTADASGNGNTGTISGATWTTSGRFGGALSFNGTSSWVTVPDSASLDLTTGMTVGAWVRPTATNGARVVLMKERTTSGLSYSVGIVDGVAASYIRTASDISTSGGSVPVNTWTHLAATYDGGTLRVYVNGVQTMSRAVTGALTTSTSPLRIGGDAPWGQYVSGLIDEVRVYNRARTASEIQSDMNAAVGGAAPSPDFSISATPSSRSITRGSSTTYTVTVGALNGFAGAVSLGVSGQPGGTTVSFSPGSITGSGNATLTVATSGATPTGSSTLTITGTSGALSRSTTVGLSVTAASVPDFTIGVSPSTRTVTRGSSTTYTVTIGAVNGFAGTVTFGTSGVPSNTTASFSPPSVTGSGTTTLTVSTTGTTPTGGFTVTVTGTSGALSHGASAGLTVTAPSGGGPSVISIDFVGTGTSMGGSESAGVVTAANWNNAAGSSRSTPLPLVNQTGAATGASVTWSASSTAVLPITDSAGSRRMMRGFLNTTSTSVTTLRVTGLPTATYDVYVYADGDNGFSTRPASYAISGPGITTTSVSLTDASNTNFNGTFVRAQNSNGNYVRFSINAGEFTITATPTGSSTTRRAPVNGLQIVPTVPPAPDFSVAATPASRTITPGASTTYSVSVTSLNGFTGLVTLGVSGLPPGASGVFQPPSVTGSGSSTLTVSTDGATPPGSRTLTVSGVSSSVTRSATVSLVLTTYSITGTISPFGSGATVSLGGAATATATANDQGVYAFSGLGNGVYSVTPQKAGYTFSPTNRTVTVNNASVSGVNFTAQPPTYSVSGSITPAGGAAGATLTLSGSTNKTTTPDGSGNFTFTGVPAGSYTIVPSNSGYSFTPASVSGSVQDTDVTGITFTAEPGANPMPLGPTGSWTLTFRDEFAGSFLDRAVWSTTYGDGGRTNNDELEWYTDDDDTHIVSNGTLKLTAYARETQDGYPYTSGMISGHNGFNQGYGFFEARMKLPSGQGFWPAFWLLPMPLTWPPEIDVMENLGHACSTVYMSNHWSSGWPGGVGEPEGGSTTQSYTGPNYCSGFHVFGVEWTPTTIDFYIDGVRRARITDHVPQVNAMVTGMYIVANLAVGGSWPGSPNASTPFPSALEIDYIRAWRR